MAHNFIKGINYIFDPTGNTAYAKRYFVSKSGNDINAGSDPNLPKRTVKEGLILTKGDYNKVVYIGTGAYHETLLPSDRVAMEGDGDVRLIGNGVDNLFLNGNTLNQANVISYMTISNYPKISDNNKQLLVFGGTFIGTQIVSDDQALILSACRLINCSVVARGTGIGLYNKIYGNIFENTTITISSSVNDISFYGNYISSNCSLEYQNIAKVAVSEYNNVRCPITVAGVNYANLAAMKLSVPSIEVNSIDQDPLFLGNPQKFEFIVDKTSPNVTGTGILYNIGSVKTGNLQNSLSLEFGTAPQSNINTNWSSGELKVTTGTEGRRESASIDLGQVFSSPIIRINAALDFLNHTPDAENLMANPNPLVFEAQWADVDGVFNGIWKKFRFGVPMQIDSNGKHSGEIGFLQIGLVNIQMRYVKVAIVLRNDYNPL